MKNEIVCTHFYVAFLFIHLLPSSTSTESYIFRVIFAMDFPRESEDYIIVIEADDAKKHAAIKAKNDDVERQKQKNRKEEKTIFIANETAVR